MTPLIVISAFVSAYMCIVQGQSTCTDPNSRPGTCVAINECQPLFALVSKPSRTKQETDTLRKAHCGYNGRTPKVCCANQAPAPSGCITPDGNSAQCVGLYSCSHIVEMLAAKPLSNEAYRFVQDSRCNGPEQYSVCCGPKPDLSTQVVGPLPPEQCRLTVMAPDPRTECCGRDGISGNRITGGNLTAVDQYPWLSLIEYRGVRDNRIKLLCGGALISGKYVLTAAHCVTGPVLNIGVPTNIRLGEYDTSNDGNDCIPAEGGGEDCTEGTVILPIEKTIPHSEYNPNSANKRHDIALIKMRQLAPYTDFIKPICLPTRDITLNPPPDFKMYAAGWGAVNTTVSASAIKLHVDLPYSPMDACQPAYNVNRRRVQLWRGQICAGGEKGKDSCKGDSGGPLMYENGRIFEVIGIVSFGPTPCGLEDIPGVYTKVYEYNNWIRTNMQP